MHNVDNAIIMAAGMSSRFAPLSYEIPKALISVNGDILIERQIKQLLTSGIHDIYIITGYKSDQFHYLKEKYNISLIYNPEYATRNNTGSIHAARKVINNSYICCADNYFKANPFEAKIDESYYAAVHTTSSTKEWCLSTDDNDYITQVTIGGYNSWYMLGHTFWSEQFSNQFLSIMENEYNKDSSQNKLWEHILIEHLDFLKMKMRKYPSDIIYEFDTLDELRKFDSSYINNTRSTIIKDICHRLCITEADITQLHPITNDKNQAIGFSFYTKNAHYSYYYETKTLHAL